MEKKLYATLTIQLFQDGKCFGPGIAELLERVQEHHSLRAAALSMHMAYSKAWTVIKRCEASLSRKLLNYSTGGKNGGGAELTEDAVQLLAAYRSYCKALQKHADRLFDQQFSAFLEP